MEMFFLYTCFIPQYNEKHVSLITEYKVYIKY